MTFAITIFILKPWHHAQPLFHLWVAFLRKTYPDICQAFHHHFSCSFLVFHHFASVCLLFRIGSASAASKGQMFHRTGKGLSDCNGFLQRSSNLENPPIGFVIFRCLTCYFGVFLLKIVSFKEGGLGIPPLRGFRTWGFLKERDSQCSLCFDNICVLVLVFVCLTKVYMLGFFPAYISFLGTQCTELQGTKKKGT